MDGQENHRLSSQLARCFETDANATQIAEAVISRWQELDAAVCPIIGRGGIVALYTRSLSLTGSAHPWFAEWNKTVQEDMDLFALKSIVAQQSSANAASVGFTLLETFRALLVSLIGASLTRELLGSEWTAP